jgi:hypothetical protein
MKMTDHEEKEETKKNDHSCFAEQTGMIAPEGNQQN